MTATDRVLLVSIPYISAFVLANVVHTAKELLICCMMKSREHTDVLPLSIGLVVF